jgi:hypothetical protein
MLEQLRLSQNWMLSDYLIDILKTKICSHWGLEALANLAESESCNLEKPSLETFAVVSIRTLPRITLKDVLDVLPERATITLNKVSCGTPVNAPLTPMYTPFMQAVTHLVHDALCESPEDSPHPTLVAVAWKMLRSNEFDFLRPTIDLLDDSYRSADPVLWNQWIADYVICTLNPGTQLGQGWLSLADIERDVMTCIAHAHVRHHMMDQTFSPLLCAVFLQSSILESCLNFVRNLHLWNPCHSRLDVKVLKSKLQAECEKCPSELPLPKLMARIKSLILESGVDCVMNWLCEVASNCVDSPDQNAISVFLASFMPVMRELKAGPLTNFYTMTTTLHGQHPELHARLVMLLTFSMVFAECCGNSLPKIFPLLSQAVIRNFVSQASGPGNDPLPSLLNMVVFFQRQKGLSEEERKNLLRVSQELLFWVINSPKISGRYELSVDTCKAILCGATLCDVRLTLQNEGDSYQNFCLIRDQVKLCSENARFSLLYCGLEYEHLNIELINELLDHLVTPTPRCKVYIPEFVMSSYTCPAIQDFKRDVTASSPSIAHAVSQAEVQPWNMTVPLASPVATLFYHALPIRDPSDDDSMARFVELFLDDQSNRDHPNQLGLSIRAASYAVEICKLASCISCADLEKEDRCLHVLKLLFEEHPAWSTFFIDQIQGMEGRVAFLRHNELCERISMPVWLRLKNVPSRQDAEVVFCMLPCQIHREDPWHSAYSSAVSLIKALNAPHVVQTPAQKQSAITTWAQQQQQQGNFAAYRARGLLLLALFDEVWQLRGPTCDCVAEWAFNAGQGHATIPQNARLFMSPDIAHAISTIARGPKSYSFLQLKADSHWGFQWIFSQESFVVGPSNLEAERLECAKLRSVYIVVLALDIGTPSDHTNTPFHVSNRLYYTTALLRPELIYHSWGLGSGMGQISKDCGLQVEVDGASWRFADSGPTAPPFPHKDAQVTKASRLINNALICSSWAWNLFLWPERSGVFQTNNLFTHSLNDARDQIYGRGVPLERMDVCNSLYADRRAMGFFQYFKEQQQQLEASREPLIAWGCCIQNVWTLACDPQVPELFGLYEVSIEPIWAQRIVGTMNRFSLAWEKGIRREPELRRLYVEKITSDSMQKRMLSAIDSSTSAVDRSIEIHGALSTFKNPKVAFEAFLSSLKITLSSEGPDNADKQHAKVLLHFLDRSQRDPAETAGRKFERQDLCMMEHVPKLITMYEWATKAFAFKYSSKNLEQQASESLEDAILALPRGKQDFGFQLLREFLKCWCELQAKFETYMQCGHELSENSVIPAFVSKHDNPTADVFLKVEDVVSLKDDENEGVGAGCHLIRMLKKLLQMQSDALLLPELLAVLNTDDSNAVNRLAFYAEPFSREFEKRISDIPTHEWPRHLITMSDDWPLLFSIIANSSIGQSSEVVYDYQAITRMVLRSAINGRFPITMESAPGALSFYQTLKVKKPLEVMNDANQSEKIDMRELERYAKERIGHLSGKQVDDADLKLLCIQCAQLHHPWTQPLTQTELSRLQSDISDMPGEHVAPVVQHLIDVVMFVLSIQQRADFADIETIGDLMDGKEQRQPVLRPPLGWNPSFSRFRRYKLEKLRDVGNKVIAAIPSRDFSTHCGLNDRLPDSELPRLQSIESRMLREPAEQRAKFHETLSNFASQLSSIIRRVSQHESPDRPLAEIDAVQDILPKSNRPRPARSAAAAAAAAGAAAAGAAAAGGRVQRDEYRVDDAALALMIDYG